MLQRQRIDIYPFRPERIAIHLKVPGGVPQLSYVIAYVKRLGCRSVLIERHYIDRDHIEDHSLFYSRSLYPYPNYCQRIHFLKTTAAATRHRFTSIVRSGMESRDAFLEECDSFSSESYLGFSVIKPLFGSPVGRTILRTFDEETHDGHQRSFLTKKSLVHVNGVELSVKGLRFQQQDVGVSACATTAIWCALQEVQDAESLPQATPAQITTMASRFALPFGRVLPAEEGLSVDQMCQAVQALGVAPNLFAAADFVTTRSYLDSALRSHMAPILIMEQEGQPDSWHAVAAVGRRLVAQPARSRSSLGIADAADALVSVYLHDDRTGPYVRADLEETKNHRLKLNLLIHRQPDVEEPWIVSHLLLPTHTKIRLSLPALRSLAADLVGWIHKASTFLFAEHQRENYPVTFTTWLTRGPGYVNNLYFGEDRATFSVVRQLVEKTIFPRYLGVVRLKSKRLGTIDVLFDTTSTSKNLHCIAVVVPQPSRNRALAASLIAQVYEAQVIA